jgi:hypothetical protein
MKVKDIIKELDLEVRTKISEDVEITGGYASDLLSDVIANAKEGNIWITLQTHQNIVAVAVLKNLAGIILVNSRIPDEETLKKAEQEKIPILISKLPAFELVGRLYNLGIRGVC